jgi:Flp pilus assembly protein TadD
MMQVLELDPDNYEAMNHKGLALLSMGRVDEATRVCQGRAMWP